MSRKLRFLGEFLCGFSEAETTLSTHAMFLAFFMFCFVLFCFVWQFNPWLATQDLHKSHSGMIFSNKACLILDFSGTFRNVSSCEIIWKTELIYIFVRDTGVATFVNHDVTQEVKKLEPMTQDMTFKIGYSVLVQTLQN